MENVTIRTLRIKLEADGSLVVSGVESAKGKLGELGNTSGSVASRMRAQWDSFRSNWLGVTAAITAGIMAIRKAWDAAAMYAKFEEQREVLGKMAEQFGITADAMIRLIQAESQGLVSMSEAADIAAKGFARGFTPDQIRELTMLATRLSDVLGNDVVEGVNKLVEAIDSGQPKAMKKLMIVFDAQEAYKEFAKKIGTTADNLNEAGKQQAFFEGAMKAGLETIRQMGPATDSLDDAMTRLTKNFDDIRLAIGQGIVRSFYAVLAVGNKVSQWFSEFMALLMKGLSWGQDILGKFGIAFETDFLAEWAKWDARAADFAVSFEENWKLAFDKAPEVVKKGMAEAAKAAEDVKKYMKVQPAAIPTPAPDATMEDLALEMLQRWADERYNIVLEETKKEKLLYNGMTEAEFDQWEKRVAIVSDGVGSMANLFQTLSNIQGKHQAASFALFKAFAIAQAIIDAYVGANRGLAIYGPTPMGFIAAAAAIATGLARVAAIIATKPGGTTAIASAVGPGIGTANQGQERPSTPTGPTIINIHFAGTVFGGNRDQIARELIGSLRKAEADLA